MCEGDWLIPGWEKIISSRASSLYLRVSVEATATFPKLCWILRGQGATSSRDNPSPSQASGNSPGRNTSSALPQPNREGGKCVVFSYKMTRVISSLQTRRRLPRLLRMGNNPRPSSPGSEGCVFCRVTSPGLELDGAHVQAGGGPLDNELWAGNLGTVQRRVRW